MGASRTPHRPGSRRGGERAEEEEHWETETDADTVRGVSGSPEPTAVFRSPVPSPPYDQPGADWSPGEESEGFEDAPQFHEEVYEPPQMPESFIEDMERMANERGNEDTGEYVDIGRVDLLPWWDAVGPDRIAQATHYMTK